MHAGTLEAEVRSGAPVVHLIGATPEALGHELFGRYERQVELSQGRAVYLKPAEHGLPQARLSFSNGGRWTIRSPTHPRKITLTARDAALAPDHVTSMWRLSDLELYRDGLNAPHVQCVTADALAAVLAAAPKTLLLCGPTPDDLCQRHLGLYERTDELVHGRPVYAQQERQAGTSAAAASTFDAKLWCANEGWFVGPPGSVGDASGYVYAKAAQPLPTLVGAGGWRVAAGAGLGWRDAAELRMVHGDELEQMKTATPRVVHLVGTTPSAQGFSRFGMYHLDESNPVNHRPAYRLADGGESALWWCCGKGGGRWFCGGAGLLGGSRGSFASGRTAALRPNDAAPHLWRVADGSNGWKDAPLVRLLTDVELEQVRCPQPRATEPALPAATRRGAAAPPCPAECCLFSLSPPPPAHLAAAPRRSRAAALPRGHEAARRPRHLHAPRVAHQRAPCLPLRSAGSSRQQQRLQWYGRRRVAAACIFGARRCVARGGAALVASRALRRRRRLAHRLARG